MIQYDKVVGFINIDEHFHSSMKTICIAWRQLHGYSWNIPIDCFVDSDEITKRMTKILVDFHKKTLLR